MIYHKFVHHGNCALVPETIEDNCRQIRWDNCRLCVWRVSTMINTMTSHASTVLNARQLISKQWRVYDYGVGLSGCPTVHQPHVDHCAHGQLIDYCVLAWAGSWKLDTPDLYAICCDKRMFGERLTWIINKKAMQINVGKRSINSRVTLTAMSL